MTIVAFVCPIKPLSVNAKASVSKKQSFGDHLRAAHAAVGGAVAAGPCYGLVYYITRAGTADADNISKPIWDALKGTAYEDDAAIRLRIAGVLNSGEDFAELDLSAVPDQAAADLLALAGQVDDLLYVEIGPLSPALYRFALATEAGR